MILPHLVAFAITAAPATPQPLIPFQRWTPMPGQVTGLLIADPSPWGWVLGAGTGAEVDSTGAPVRGAADASPVRELVFLRDEESPRRPFFSAPPGQGTPETFYLPDGGPFQIAEAPLPTPPLTGAHWARLQVNGGGGSMAGNPGFAATRVTLLDGDSSFPPAEAVLGRAHAQYRRFRAESEPALQAALERDWAWRTAVPKGFKGPDVLHSPGEPYVGAYGTIQQHRSEGFYVSWNAGRGELRVVFMETITRQALRPIHYFSPAEVSPCPPRSPSCRPRLPARWIDSTDPAQSQVQLGDVLTFNRRGELIAEQRLPPRT